MHQAHFYSLLPSSWKDSAQYLYISATHAECKDVELWALTQPLPEPGATAKTLLRAYDPLGVKSWNPWEFSMVLPATWRERMARGE